MSSEFKQTKLAEDLLTGFDVEALKSIGEGTDELPLWKGVPFPSNPQEVLSVNGKTGVVSISRNDLQASPLRHTHNYTEIVDWQAGVWAAMGLIFRAGEGLYFEFDNVENTITFHVDNAAYQNINTYSLIPRLLGSIPRNSEVFIPINSPNVNNVRIVNAFMEIPSGTAIVSVHDFNNPEYHTYNPNEVVMEGNLAALRTGTRRRRRYTSQSTISTVAAGYKTFSNKFVYDINKLRELEITSTGEKRTYDYIAGNTDRLISSAMTVSGANNSYTYAYRTQFFQIGELSSYSSSSSYFIDYRTRLNNMRQFNMDVPRKINHTLIHLGYNGSYSRNITPMEELIDNVDIALLASMDNVNYIEVDRTTLKRSNFVTEVGSYWDNRTTEWHRYFLTVNFPNNTSNFLHYKVVAYNHATNNSYEPFDITLDTTVRKNVIYDVKLLENDERFLIFKRGSTLYWLNENYELENIGASVSPTVLDRMKRYNHGYINLKEDEVGRLATTMMSGEIETLVITKDNIGAIDTIPYFKSDVYSVVTPNIYYNATGTVSAIQSFRRTMSLTNGARMAFVFEIEGVNGYWYYNWTINDWVNVSSLNNLEFGVNTTTSDEFISLDQANIAKLLPDQHINDYQIKIHTLLFDNPLIYSCRAEISNLEISGQTPSSWTSMSPTEVRIQLYRKSIGITRLISTNRPILINYQD